MPKSDSRLWALQLGSSLTIEGQSPVNYSSTSRKVGGPKLGNGRVLDAVITCQTQPVDAPSYRIRVPYRLLQKLGIAS